MLPARLQEALKPLTAAGPHTNATFLIGNDKTLKQALEAQQIGNAMCFSCGNDSTNEERSTNPFLSKEPSHNRC